eukprot:TRINITY_DN5135_c0_g1::TRINITY_DN5135_c0_g1_i1::g.29394::m.29394 TRINITY_DN5135_c0_g1::TRINITY_DN5135_c0_g1_i1::g.29394  ORF type:complete len:100 (-),score=1.55 TRINITY_DN5135_c0_g1_i1:166-465(-)
MADFMPKRMASLRCPLVMGEIGSFVLRNPDSRFICAQQVLDSQHRISASLGIPLVHTQDLTDRGDLLHFDLDSVHIMGHRYAKLWVDNFAKDYADDRTP